MKKFYVATDFSDVSENAVRFASDMAQHFKASLHLVHVYESPLFYTAEMPYTAIEAAENLAKSDAESKSATLLQSIKSSHPGLQVEAIIRRGMSSDTITEEADANNADLLIAGTTGAGVVERALIGTTTTSLINKSKCMVLIVPANAKFRPIDRLVYTTDLNENNIAKANSLLDYASSMNAELIFLFVDNKIHTDSEKISEEMSAKIKSNVTYPKTSGYICTDADVMNGINTFIHKMDADMIAMVTRHRSFPGMLWDKSLTTKFSYHPEIPLLVIHAEG